MKYCSIVFSLLGIAVFLSIHSATSLGQRQSTAQPATVAPGGNSTMTNLPGDVTGPEATADTNSLDSIPEVRQGLELLNSGERAKAAELFAAAYKKRPDLIPAGAAVAVAMFNEKRFDQTRYWLERTIDDCPDDPEAYLALAEIAQLEGRLYEAKILAAQGLTLTGQYKSNPERQKKLAIRGQLVLIMVSEKKENWEDAKTRLEALIARVPDESEYLTRLGVVLFQMNDLEKSLKVFGQAIEKGAPLPPPYALVAQLLNQKGRTSEAVTYINEAIKANPGNFQVASIAANLAVQWEKIPQAKKYADTALKLKPDSLDAQAMCGLIALYEQNYEQAQKYYEGILKEDPNNFYGINGLALALCEQKDETKVGMGLAYAKRNAEANPNSIDALSTLAWVSFKAGQVDTAETILNRVQSTGVISAAGAYYLAEIKQHKGEKELATTLANAALSTKNNYPKKAAAQELLQKLQK
ncbi:MAG: tetratricopeptide repeat protein [Planctomycetaceae bacterium]|nr:tetratricopeptide repeat protein [Planctomycetaceae bacterium]